MNVKIANPKESPIQEDALFVWIVVKLEVVRCDDSSTFEKTRKYKW